MMKHKKRKRVGRGHSSGWGKTAGRGHKGQKSRTGGGVRPGFEGGQTPLYRRLPKKRGFSNIVFKAVYSIVNLDQLGKIKAGETVNPEKFLKMGVTKKIGDKIKVLGRGEVKNALTVQAHKFSGSAKKAIEAAGGKAEVLA